LLRVGAIGLSASALPPGVATATESASGNRSARASSVIFLWMGGGVTHLDSFDPKPEAPEEVRGTLATIATRLPGVQFTEAMPNLARIADRLALVRSFSHDSNDHLLSQAYTLSGRKVTPQQLFSEPNLGAVVAFLHGSRQGLPGYIAVPGITRPGPPPHNLFVGGWLGDHFAPFAVGGVPAQPDFTVGEKSDNPSPICDEDLRPRTLALPADLSTDRLASRARLRERLEQSLAQAERSRLYDTVEGNFQGALHLLTAPQVRQAFDVTLESAATREAYGPTKLGNRCLLARRLVEAGARFVMVDYGYDPDYGNLWDNHAVASQRQPHISQMALRGYHLAGLDRAFAALISDLETRGMLDSTLVVFLTEFGRTPKINPQGGRDHWGAAGSIFFAGAGVRAGQVIGSTDRQGGFPTSRAYSPADVAASIYSALGIDLETRLPARDGRPRPVLETGHAIPDLWG